MKNDKPNDRLPEDAAADGQGKPEVYAVTRGKSGWELSRRAVIAAVAATVSGGAQRTAEAQSCAGSLAHNGEVSGIALSADGRTLITAGWDGAIKLWRLPEGAHFKTMAEPTVNAVAAEGNNRFDSASNTENMVRVWSAGGAPLPPKQGHTAPVRALAADASGELLASGSDDHTVRLWNLKAQTSSSPHRAP